MIQHGIKQIILLSQLQNSIWVRIRAFFSGFGFCRKSPTLNRVCQFAAKPNRRKNHRIQPPKRVLQLALLIFGFSTVFLCSIEPVKSEKAVFTQLSSITVTPVVCGAKIDKNRVKATIERVLSSFGSVSPDNPKNFGGGNSVLNITIGPIAEQNTKPDSPAKYLPALSVSMQLLTGAELISDKQVTIFGLAWEQQGYIDSNQKDLDSALDKTIQYLLSDLREKYKETKTKPSFFLQQL